MRRPEWDKDKEKEQWTRREAEGAKLQPISAGNHIVLLTVMSRNKSPNRAQLSSRLAYEKKLPAFLQKLQNKINGVGNDDDEDDDNEPQRYYEGRGYDEDEFETIDDGSGRPPIPRRPRSRERARPPIPEVSLYFNLFMST